jgi:hypothetical protein
MPLLEGLAMSAQHIKHRPALLRFVRALAWLLRRHAT